RLAEENKTTMQPPPSVLADVYQTWARRVTLAGDGHLVTLLKHGPVVFEGAQGVLLDEWHGFHPYTTWSTTTFANAETLLAEAGETAARLGVIRCYLTRHGPGPFVSEDPALDLPEPHNRTGRWQGPVRTGHLDAVALRYAAEVAGGLDAVALTHLDVARRHEGELRLCRQYSIGGQTATRLSPGPDRDLAHAERLTRLLLSARPVYDETERITARDWPGLVAGITGAPVTIRSHGPAATDKTAAPAPISRPPARTAPPR
ncbi:MAG TPA: adenylosuccinate synthetase, partial [Trebonia sp.]|nr:adenylosuccinate synthetase [Trebonia sp.]